MFSFILPQENRIIFKLFLKIACTIFLIKKSIIKKTAGMKLKTIKRLFFSDKPLLIQK